jgi:alpha-glucosidase
MNYIGEKEIDTLTLDVYLGDKANIRYKHYVDDESSFEYRDGKYNLYDISIEAKECLDINIELVNDGYEKKYNSYELIVNSLKYKKAMINNKEVDGEVRGNSIIFKYSIKYLL